MPSPLLNKYIPKYSYPGFKSLLYGRDRDSDPMDDTFQKAAEYQIDKEGEDQNAFFTLLDYLARPQRAVAGVIKDLIDGGDFSPLDRVGKALAGQEKYGIKEVIDVMAPGTWKSMQLPEWLGGKPIDAPKEVVGFIGDVLTDPLMSVRLFTQMGKVARFGTEEAAFLRKLARTEEKTLRKQAKVLTEVGGELKETERFQPGFISSQLLAAAKKEEGIIGIGQHTMGAIAANRATHRELYHLWKKMVDNPVEFQRSLKSKEAREMFAKAIDPSGKFRNQRFGRLLSGDAKDIVAESWLGPRASPVLSERFAKGEASLIAFKMPWLMRQLGIPDGKWSLIPKLDEKWGSALARGMEKFTANVMNTKVGVYTKQLADSIFRHGTGVPEADMLLMQAASHGRMEARQLDQFAKEIRSSFGGQLTKENLDLLTDHLIYRRNVLGTLMDIPEEVNGFQLRKAVEMFSGMLEARAKIHNITPGLKHGLIGGQFSDYRAWKALNELQKQKAAEGWEMTPFAITPFSKLKRLAKTRAEQFNKELDLAAKGEKVFDNVYIADDLVKNPVMGDLWAYDLPVVDKTTKKAAARARIKEGAGFVSREEKGRRKVLVHSFYKTELGKLIREEQDKAAQWAGDLVATRAPWETGYLPRVMTDEAKELLEQVIMHPQVFYKGKQASRVFMENAKTRSLTGLDHMQLNKLFHDGALPYDFMEQIISSARKNLQGKDRNVFQKLLRMMDETDLRMYIEDPVQATFQYLAGSVKATTKANQINAVARLFLRPIDDLTQMHLGERYALLTRDGMEAVFGKEWRAKIGEGAAKSYDSMAAKGQLTSMQGLGGLLADVKNITDLHTARTFGVPVFAVPNEVLEGMNRYHGFLNNPEQWRGLLKTWHNVTNMWKSATLAIFPSYHARNFLSGFHQAFFADSLEMAGYSYANRLFKHKGVVAVGKGGESAASLAKPVSGTLDDLTVPASKTWNKQAYSAEQCWSDLQKHDVLMSSWYARELMQNAKGQYWASGLMPKSVTEKAKNAIASPFRLGYAVGNFADNWHRVAHYITKIRQGMSPFEAARSTRKYFFDYQELGMVEKALFRNVFPFYTWLRKNIPLQLEFLATNPGKFANLQRTIELIQSPEAAQFDRKKLPQWVTDAGGIPTRINPETGDLEVKLLASWAPSSDLMNVTSLHSLFQTGAELLHPIPKGLLENFQNRSFYTQQPIENYPGEPAETPFLGMDLSKRKIHNLKNLRILNEINRMMTPYRPGGEVEFASRLADFFAISPKTKAFDIERLEYAQKRKIAERKGVLKRGYTYAGKVSDRRAAKYIKDIQTQAQAAKP